MVKCPSVLENIPHDASQFTKNEISYDWSYAVLKWVYTGILVKPENVSWDRLKEVVWTFAVWHLAPLCDEKNRTKEQPHITSSKLELIFCTDVMSDITFIIGEKKNTSTQSDTIAKFRVLEKTYIG